ncbi:MAG: hypothetical protein ABID04_04115 [Patescibacteria group bacterium]
MDYQRILRLILFLLASGGLVWFLSRQNLGQRPSLVEGETSDNLVQVLGDNIEEALPEEIKQRISLLEEKVFKKSIEVVEETEIVKEVKKTIQQATEDVGDFPEKKTKEIKKEVIEQVCQELLKEFE